MRSRQGTNVIDLEETDRKVRITKDKQDALLSKVRKYLGNGYWEGGAQVQEEKDDRD